MAVIGMAIDRDYGMGTHREHEQRLVELLREAALLATKRNLWLSGFEGGLVLNQIADFVEQKERHLVGFRFPQK